MTDLTAIWPKWLQICDRGESIYKYSLDLIPAWISDKIHYKKLNEITHPLPKFNGTAVEVW